ADMYESLTPQQRLVADNVIMKICRGDYIHALCILRGSVKRGHQLPQFQDIILQRMILRLIYPMENDQDITPLGNNKELMEQLNLHGLDSNLIDTNIPKDLLGKIYEKAVTLSFEQFYRHLEHLQWVEHTIIHHTLVLYVHCLKLKLAQQAINRLEVCEGLNLELAFLYGLVLLTGIFLVSLLF
ncbi:hypothetical protein KR074_001142, partial [Drosophila pseudoananassae]